MAKILRNDSSPAVEIELKSVGATIQSGGASNQYTIDTTEYPLWASDDAISEVTPHINSGDIVINDGIGDLDAADGINYLKYPDEGFNIRFASETERTNGFSAKNVQTAIEEARNSAIGALVPYVFVTTGNTSDKWLGAYVPSTFSNVVPLMIMQEVDVKGILFSNQDDDVDIDVCIYKNGVLVHTEDIRNKRTYYNVGIPGGPTFVQGDRMSVFLKKYTGGSGDNTAQNPIVWVVVKVVGEIGGSGGTQNGV